MTLKLHQTYTDSEADGTPIGWYCLSCDAGERDGTYPSEAAAEVPSDAHERRHRIQNALWRLRHPARPL